MILKAFFQRLPPGLELDPQPPIGLSQITSFVCPLMQEEAQNPLCVIEILALLYLTRKKFGQGFPLPLCLKYDNSKMTISFLLKSEGHGLQCF